VPIHFIKVDSTRPLFQFIEVMNPTLRMLDEVARESTQMLSIKCVVSYITYYTDKNYRIKTNTEFPCNFEHL
jgi:hypothetical protein